jgi:CRP-like cAMP-binding protein
MGFCQAIGSDDVEGLADLEAARLPVRIYEPGDMILTQGDAAHLMMNVISGWVFLHQDMADGRRHITRFLLPGSFFGVEPEGIGQAQGATALTSTIVCPLPRLRVDELRQRHPALNEHFIWMLERDNHLAVDSLTNMSKGTAIERVAHLLWELITRLSAPAPVQIGEMYKVPLTQRLIADATGLTSIHVNRVLRVLRERRVVEMREGNILVIDLEHLASLAGADLESTDMWRRGAPVPRPNEDHWGAPKLEIEPQRVPRIASAAFNGRRTSAPDGRRPRNADYGY